MMRECICCQCSEHAVGYEPEYFQCESCDLYGTKDDFEDSETVCCSCVEFHSTQKEKA